MPDITMCEGKECPAKDQCYRYTAKPSLYQSYFAKVPYKDGKCDNYWGKDADNIWFQLKNIVNPNTEVNA